MEIVGRLSMLFSEPAHRRRDLMQFPAPAIEWLVGGGALAIVVMLSGNVRRMAGGLRGAIRWVAGVDRKIDAVDAAPGLMLKMHEQSDALESILDQFKPNGGGLREAVNRIDANLTDIASEIRAKQESQQITLNMHELALADLAGKIEDARISRNTENEHLRGWFMDHMEQGDAP